MLSALANVCATIVLQSVLYAPLHSKEKNKMCLKLILVLRKVYLKFSKSASIFLGSNNNHLIVIL